MTAQQSPRLDRGEAVKKLLEDRGDLLIVTGLGGAAHDVVGACGEHPLTFCMSGGMGGASIMGLGLALAQPSRRVAVIAGDGDLLMGLGSLATIAVEKPANLAVVIVDNERFGETGNQETHTAHGVDLAGMAEAAGFPVIRKITRADELDEARGLLRRSNGPVFILLKVSPDPVRAVPRTRDATWRKNRFRETLLDKA